LPPLALLQADGHDVHLLALEDGRSGLTFLGLAAEPLAWWPAAGSGAAAECGSCTPQAAQAAHQQALLLLFSLCGAVVLVQPGPTLQLAWLHRLRAVQNAAALLGWGGRTPPTLHLVLQVRGGQHAAVLPPSTALGGDRQHTARAGAQQAAVPSAV
jgi:hypothetical protein